MFQNIQFYGKNFTIRTITLTTTGLPFNQTIHAMSGKILIQILCTNQKFRTLFLLYMKCTYHVFAIAFHYIALFRDCPIFVHLLNAFVSFKPCKLQHIMFFIAIIQNQKYTFRNLIFHNLLLHQNMLHLKPQTSLETYQVR